MYIYLYKYKDVYIFNSLSFRHGTQFISLGGNTAELNSNHCDRRFFVGREISQQKSVQTTHHCDVDFLSLRTYIHTRTHIYMFEKLCTYYIY